MTAQTPRSLTPTEQAIITKLVEASPAEFSSVLDQLPQAQVTGRCNCGCATIDISVANDAPVAAGGFSGLLPAEGSILRGPEPADGLIVFLRDGRLVGLEVYGVAEKPTRELPPADQIIVAPSSDVQ